MKDISHTGFGDAGNSCCPPDVESMSPDDPLKGCCACANDFDCGLRSEYEKARFANGPLDCEILLATFVWLGLVIRASSSKEGDVCGVAYEF